MVKIKVLKKPNAAALKAVNRMMAQMSLSPTPAKPTSPKLFLEMLSQKNYSFLLAEADLTSGKDIVGILILYFVRVPSGPMAILEDLVIDEKYRGWGVGALLVKEAIEMAKKRKARHISLRTNPKRIEANKMYLSMGFHKMETNFYRINLFK